MTLMSPVQLLPDSDCELPTSTRTRSGVTFDPSQRLWKYRDGVNAVSLDFRDINAPTALCKSLKRVLVWYAEHHSPSHLTNLFMRFRHFASTIRLSKEEIRSAHLINYRATLDASTEWYLGSLSGLLKRWSRMHVPGVSADAATYLRSIRVRGKRLEQLCSILEDPSVPTGTFITLARPNETGRPKLSRGSDLRGTTQLQLISGEAE